ncbi:MAG TPA: CDP-alcohol phosphatidyltransferase family protein [Actinomycetota bacterium]|nr:CDP-alcohol phosphatidyltransferase family protein [Actinomycetota bacterium]
MVECAAMPSEPIPEKPREVKGLIAPIIRVALAAPWRGALRLLLWMRVTADHLTMASLALNIWIAVLLAQGNRLLPGLLLLPAGLLDVFDGSVARARGTSGNRGAYLDALLDRASDAAVLGGLFLSLTWQARSLQAALALGALAVSLFVSHVRAEAAARGVTMGEGLFARLERYVALMIGLVVPGALPWALAALVVLGGVTVIQRILIVRKALSG